MKLEIKTGSLKEGSSEVAVIGFFEDKDRSALFSPEAVSLARRLIKEVRDSGDFKGKEGEITVLFLGEGRPAKRLLLLGLGKRENFSPDTIRKGIASALNKISSLKLPELSLSFVPVRFRKSLTPRKQAQALAEGLLLGNYRFDRYITDQEKLKGRQLAKAGIFLGGADLKEIKKGLKIGEKVAGAVCCTRDLVSAPPKDLSPSLLAEKARELANKKGFSCRVLDKNRLKKLKMGGILGVGQGSAEPSLMIVLEYSGGKRKTPKIGLVGKGITFDSGGLSLKPSKNMDHMKADMSGAAVVVGVFQAVADLKLPVNLVGLIPAAENLPSGNSYKPSDILTMRSGKTVEVLNTDAEGRLLLADALSYIGEFKPDKIIDLATLTGACVVALGDDIAGIMGNDDPLKDALLKASRESAEEIWPLPLNPKHTELMKSKIADIANISSSPYGGTMTAAAFLKEFVGDRPWAHIDIAGPAMNSKGPSYQPEGAASGFGVRLLTQYLTDLK
ncbi:MAG: leucyl aminopeptidase [bacterium]